MSSHSAKIMDNLNLSSFTNKVTLKKRPKKHQVDRTGKEAGSFPANIPSRLETENRNDNGNGNAPSALFEVFGSSTMSRPVIPTRNNSAVGSGAIRRVQTNPETSGSSQMNNTTTQIVTGNLGVLELPQPGSGSGSELYDDYDPFSTKDSTGPPHIGSLVAARNLKPIELPIQDGNSEIDKPNVSCIVREVESLEEEENSEGRTRLENVHRSRRNNIHGPAETSSTGEEGERQEASASESEDDLLGEKYARLRRRYKGLRGANELLMEVNQTLKKKNNGLTRTNQRLMETNETLIKDSEMWKERYEYLTSVDFSNRRKYWGLEAAFQARSIEVEKFDNLQEKYNDLSETLKAYDEQLKNLEQTNTILNEQATEASAELAKYLLEPTPLESDDHFRKEWRKLDGKILSWAQNNFKGKLPSRSSERRAIHEEHHFRHVAKDHKKYIESEDRRPLFVQSFVWSLLVDKVFTNFTRSERSDLRGLFWSESQRDNLDSLGAFLYPDIDSKKKKATDEDIREYMKWKAATSQLILQEINTDPETDTAVYAELIEQLVNYIIGHLQPLNLSSDIESCLENLRDILYFAIKLDGTIYQQWAILLPRYQKKGREDTSLHSFPFDSTMMEDAEGKRATGGEYKVQMVITPALIMYGTKDGEQYNDSKVLVPAQVHMQRFYRSSQADSVKESVEEPTVEENKSRDSGGGIRKKALEFVGIRR